MIKNFHAEHMKIKNFPHQSAFADVKCLRKNKQLVPLNDADGSKTGNQREEKIICSRMLACIKKQQHAINKQAYCF